MRTVVTAAAWLTALSLPALAQTPPAAEADVDQTSVTLVE
jgi:hypothetical protein